MTYEQDNQFEKLAHYLDGEDVKLTPADREVLDEFNRNEAEVSSQLDVELPKSAGDRALRRMNAALLAKPRSTLRFKLVGIAGIAAAMILGIGLFWANSNDNAKPQSETSSGVVQVSEDDLDIDTVMFDAVQEQLVMQEEDELFVLLEPLYAEDTVDFWDENDEIGSYNGVNGT